MSKERRFRGISLLALGTLLGVIAFAPAVAHHKPKHTKKQIKQVRALAMRAATPFNFTVAEGTTGTTLISYPPFTIKGDCVLDAGSLETNIYVETTEDGTAFGGDDTDEGSIGPATPVADRTFEDPGASSGSTPEHSDGYDDQFSVWAPSGKALNGTVSSIARNDANSCTYYGHWTTVA